MCRNGSFHLRGNVYIQYKSLDSAVMAYNSVHGRYFAGKQVKCEFVSLSRWKVALCGEYMKSRLKTCSRGSACNFLHCFMNPGGDYKWADSDKPPPRFWVEKMVALFGHSDDETCHNKQIEQPSPSDHHRIFTSDNRDSYHEKRNRSIEKSQHNGSSSKSHHDENHIRKSKHREQKNDNKNQEHETKYKNNDSDSDGDRLNKNTPRRHREGSQNHSRHKRSESRTQDYYRKSKRRTHGSSSDEEDFHTKKRHFDTKSRSRSPENKELDDVKYEPSERERERSKERKTDRRRSRRRDRDGGSGEVERRRRGGSRSGDGECFLERSEMSDRWVPEGSPDELKILERDSKRSYEENRRSHEPDKIREKRKRI